MSQQEGKKVALEFAKFVLASFVFYLYRIVTCTVVFAVVVTCLVLFCAFAWHMYGIIRSTKAFDAIAGIGIILIVFLGSYGIETLYVWSKKYLNNRKNNP